MSGTLRNVLLPFSALYGGGVSVRNFGYDSGFFKVKKLPVPVVSVGNISVGGSGKTPFVMLLIEKFLASGKKPAVLSRGYKRLTDELVIACPARGSEVDVQLLGDEPALISLNFPEVPVAVLTDRHRAGMAVLEKFGADVFIMDDGLQNRELHRDLDFVLMKHSLFDLKDYYLPAGNLRDSKRRIRQADVIVLTAHAGISSGENYGEILSRYSGAPVAAVSYLVSDLRDHAGASHSSEILHDKEVVAFCGIANPQPFFEGAGLLGGNVVARKSFRDHHWYDEYDIDEIFGGREDVVAVTTTKDAVRIFQDEELSQLDDVQRIYAVNEKAVMNFGEEHIDSALSGIFGSVYA
jgi:tetraacyldisaccharide 4'-kinase